MFKLNLFSSFGK